MISPSLRSTVTAVMLPIAGLAAPSAAAHGTPGLSVEPVREVQYSTYLRTNSSTSARYVVKGVCEREGLRQISHLLRRSEVEEMWALLPRANGTRECQWHEIGRDEKSEADRSYLQVDMGYLAELMARNTEVQLVHFHPLRYFECAARADCPKKAPAGRAASAKRWLMDLVFSMPSPSDVHFMMNLTSRFARLHQGAGKIAHKVVTPYGVVDYGLTEQGLARFDSEQHGRSGGMYITMVMASALDDDRIEAVVKENPRDIGAAVQKLARSLNTKFLRVEHTPAQ